MTAHGFNQFFQGAASRRQFGFAFVHRANGGLQLFGLGTIHRESGPGTARCR